MNTPRARREGLRVKKIVDGRLAVYDEHAEQGHLLSPLCATVFHPRRRHPHPDRAHHSCRPHPYDGGRRRYPARPHGAEHRPPTRHPSQ